MFAISLPLSRDISLGNSKSGLRTLWRSRESNNLDIIDGYSDLLDRL